MLNSLFKIPFKDTTLKKLVPKVLLLSSLIPNNSLLCKNVLESICKSVIVLSTYPLEEGDKVTVDKYEGILKNYNFWFLTLKKRIVQFIFLLLKFIIVCMRYMNKKIKIRFKFKK